MLKPTTKILVIGAGPAGLSSLKALQKLPQEQYEIDCFEKQNDLGGQWNYSWRSGVDEFGERVHTSMYSQLWTNLPKECFEFPDYTFKDHFKKSVPSFLPRDIYKGYFMTRFQKNGLQRYVRKSQTVRNVRYLDQQGKFQARITDIKNNSDQIKFYDKILVASGHYTVPNVPELEGIQNFTGRILHSHDVKQFTQFKDQNVMIVGGGLSAQDFVLQCLKYGSKNISWANRRLKYNYVLQNMPERVEVHPVPLQFKGNDIVRFGDSKEKSIDIIVFCTGYLHYYHFMQENLRLKQKNVIYPRNLYKGVALQKNPNVFYIGMGNYNFSQVIFDIQAYLVRDIITGKHQLPKDLSQPHQSDLRRFQQAKMGKSATQIATSVAKYARQMMNETQYPQYNVEGIVQLYDRCLKTREQNILTYRDQDGYKSCITGQLSAKGNFSWFDVKDSQTKRKNLRNEKLDQFFQFDY